MFPIADINDVDKNGRTALDMLDENIGMYRSPTSREESCLDLGQRRRNHESAIELRAWMV